MLIIFTLEFVLNISQFFDTARNIVLNEIKNAIIYLTLLSFMLPSRETCKNAETFLLPMTGVQRVCNKSEVIAWIAKLVT